MRLAEMCPCSGWICTTSRLVFWQEDWVHWLFIHRGTSSLPPHHQHTHTHTSTPHPPTHPHTHHIHPPPTHPHTHTHHIHPLPTHTHTRRDVAISKMNKATIIPSNSRHSRITFFINNIRSQRAGACLWSDNTRPIWTNSISMYTPLSNRRHVQNQLL